MEILHISDLHKTESKETLKNTWSSTLPVIESTVFDYIVVSGDLSTDGNDYSDVDNFIRNTLIGHVKNKQRARIILVPGNHDVSWSDFYDTTKQLSIVNEVENSSEKLKEKFKEYKEEPFSSDLRVSIGDFGHLEFYEIDRGKYNKRFNNVQNFLRGFYNINSNRNYTIKKFKLTGESEGNDWSAHIFKKDRIAFYGFNSCFGNDKYWIGAKINPTSITDAGVHARRHAKDCRLIAIWHHGIQGTDYRPDYLNHVDIGNLYKEGFRIGFHGHTHYSLSQDIRHVFKNNFILLSTGTFGSGAKDRPSSIPKQFSIISLFPEKLKVKVYERNDTNSQIKIESEKAFPLYDYIPSENSAKADSICRTYVTDKDGITEVKVAIKNLRNGIGAILAILTPPFCYFDYEKAKCGSQHVDVHCDERKDGRVLFMLLGNKNERTILEWTYRFSCGFALESTDLLLRRNSEWLPAVAEGFEARPYTLRIECDHLKIIIKYSDSDCIAKTSVYPLIGNLSSKEHPRKWLDEPDDSNRCQIVKASNSEIELDVLGPVVGKRYSIGYKIKKSGKLPDHVTNEITEKILNSCRRTPFETNSVCSYLTEAIESGLASALETEISKTILIGFIWDQKKKCLLPSFGRFPNRYWTREFNHGSGLVGHCFRYGNFSAWVKSDKESLIFRPTNIESYSTQNYEWVVAFPILLKKEGPAVGAISWEDRGLDENLRDRIKNKIIAAKKKKKAGKDFFNDLTLALNEAFWGILNIRKIIDTQEATKKISSILRDLRK